MDLKLYGSITLSKLNNDGSYSDINLDNFKISNFIEKIEIQDKNKIKDLRNKIKDLQNKRKKAT